MNTLLDNKLTRSIIGFLKQGIAPPKLALAVALGIVIAIIPVFGSASLLCLLAIRIFRLNPGLVFLVNQLAYPLQFVCFLPFIRMGEWIFQVEPLPFSLSQIVDMVSADVLEAFVVLGWSILRATLAWLILSVPLTVLLYLQFRWVFIRVERRRLRKAGATGEFFSPDHKV